MDKSNKKNKSNLLWIGLIIFVIVAVFILFIPLLVTNCSWIGLNVEKPNEIGDAVGGTMGPAVGLLAALLTFLAFWAQIRANQKVQEQFEFQKFESQFYEMLKIHNENVKEMEIGNTIKGRKCFVRMFNELEFIYRLYFEIKKDIDNKNYLNPTKASIEQDMEIIYHFFFYGVGPNSDRLLEPIYPASVNPVIVELKKCLYIIRHYYKHNLNWGNDKNILLNDDLYYSLTSYNNDYSMKNNTNNDIVKHNYIRNIINIDNKKMNFNIYYTPFDGNSMRLSHYYRHLILLLKMVLDSEVINDYESKMEYIKIIRAQLSNHEQLHLYFNSFATFGNQWLDLKLFSDYMLIKNASFELITEEFHSPLDYFKLLAKESEKYGFQLKEIEGKVQLLNSEGRAPFDYC